MVPDETVNVRIDAYIIGLYANESKGTDFSECPESLLLELDLMEAFVEVNGVITRRSSNALLFKSFLGHFML